MIRLDEAAIERALPLLATGLEKYCRIQAALMTTDVATDRQFQRAFNTFYGVYVARRDAVWQAVFYTLLEREKSHPSSFAEVLRALHAATGRVEASFASKLAATVDPDKPVIDSVVLKNLGLKLTPTGAADARMARIEVLHERLRAMYAEFLDTAIGRHLTDRFVERFPDRPVTRVKMLDLVLWQTR